ncbi:MAG: hypothetical protein L0Z52_03165 [Acidobacteria bacterium]|nr:hypothetical protein [Acidobacteriota bacterium]
MAKERTFGKHWPLLTAIALYLVMLAVLAFLAARQNQGHLIYAFDDAYIHMAMAKNFALQGVWGVNRDGFTSTSSSLLWTLLLSATYRLFGVSQIAPLILNVLSGLLALVAGYLFLAKTTHRRWVACAGLLLLVLAVPLPSLAMTGMEHSLHLALAILFLSLSASCLSKESPDAKQRVVLLVMAPLLAATRYEGLFLVAVVCLLLLLRGKAGFALGLGAIASLPMVIYGALSVREGWFFLPNSLLLKTSVPGLASLDQMGELAGKASIRRLWDSPHFLALVLPSLLAVIVLSWQGKNPWKSIAICSNLSFIGAMLLHLHFVGQGWTFRHEGYLMALGAVVLAGAAGELLRDSPIPAFHRHQLPGYLSAALLVALIGYPIGKKAAKVLLQTPRATTNIYQQQYQMGLFLHRFYDGQSVAANDIGAISFLADLHLLDLAGLASREVAFLQRSRQLNAAQVKSLTDARGTSIAIVYEGWFEGVRENWIKAGEWKIQNNVICASNTISFWAVDPSRKLELLESLNAFAAELPPEVIQSGEYLQRAAR